MKGTELLKLSHEDLALHAIEGWNLADSLRAELAEALGWKHLMTVQLGTAVRERDSLKLQLRAMVEERDLYSDVVDAAKLWLKHHGEVSHSTYYLALKYQVERLGSKVTEKPKGEGIPDRHWTGGCEIHHAVNCPACTEKRIRPTPECEAAAYTPGYPCPRCKHIHD